MAYNPECLCNLLLVLQVSAQVNLQQRQRLSEAKSGLSNKAKLFANTLPFSDPLGVGKTEFNFQQKDPHQSGAQQSSFYELLLLKQSYHPSVKLFGTTYL